ncbi:MAG: ABC transporter transmembrane domain-containing protein, partial [Desulfobacterales bacterium]|nr:ABC transporter transmembrane domain-containing protein [Desulfobacterales bacterium]
MKRIRLLKLTPRHIELLQIVKQNWFKLTLAAICSAIVAGMTSYSAYLVKPVVEDIFEQKDAARLLLIPLLVVAVFLTKGVAAYVSYYLFNLVGQDIILRLRNRLYNHIQDLPLAFFQREKTGDLMSRITNDVTIISGMFTSAITGAIR